MKKYLAVAKILFKAQFAYRFDVIFTALGTIWKVVFAYILWGAVFAERAEVGGFTFQAMLSYYVVSAFLTTMDLSDGVSGELASRIREGTFSKYMVIPDHPLPHFLAQTAGAGGYYGLFAALAAAVSTLVFRVQLAVTGDPRKILLAAVIFLLGVVFMNCYSFFLGVWAFKFQEISFLTQHTLPAIVAFLKGEFVPLALLPAVFGGILPYLPFTHVAYTPTMLLTGRMSLDDGLHGLAVLAVWTAGMWLAAVLAYRRLRIRYEGVGI